MPSYVRGSDNFDSGQVIGQNQTWQDVTASRVAGTTYTNSTGKPITVSISTFSSTNDVHFNINGSTNVLVCSGGGLCIVPNNATYTVTLGAGSITKWSELR